MPDPATNPITADGQNAVLGIQQISKRFPGVQALSAVSLALYAGEVHALVGENGAGKSTLSRILCGIEHADAGTMHLRGEVFQPGSKREAEAGGVRMVMQEMNLIANLSVAENIFITQLPARFGFIRYSVLHAQARELMRQVGLERINPATPVHKLGVGQQQMVEIAAGLSQQCRVLILDEPTASLTDSETRLLFQQIAKLKAAGVSIVYISHRMEEIMEIADRVTVLRDGCHVRTLDTAETDIDMIINLMVGRQLDAIELHRPTPRLTETAMRVEGLRCGEKVQGVDFELKKGQILGFAGLMGSGRTETMRAIFGADKAEAGAIYLHGSDTPTRIRRCTDAVRHRIAFLTENRKEQGLFLSLSIRVNTTITQLRALSTAGFIHQGEEDRVTRELAGRLNLKYYATRQLVSKLSGGNQQKVVLAKWLLRNCDILIFDEPTRGIDVGAKFEIYKLLNQLTEQGKAIIFISSDLKELMAVCDHIAVMSAGKLVNTFERGDWDQERIMAAAFSAYK